MRRLLPLAVVFVALTVSRADEKVNAPVPKAPTPTSIDGKYVLIAQSAGVTTSPSGKTTPFGSSDGPGGPLGRAGTRSETTITKNEIIIEGRAGTMDYTLDTTKTPITIDVESISIRGKKTKMLGIVETNGNRVTIALSKEGLERPRTTDEADGVTVYFFQKAPPPKIEFRIVAMTVGKEADAEKELNKLANEGFELVSTTNPAATDPKASPTTVHFILKRTVKQHP